MRFYHPRTLPGGAYALIGIFVGTLLAAAEPNPVVVAGGSLDGQILLGELNCVACHAADAAVGHAAKQSPVLTDVAGRVTPQYLQALLADPQQAKPGTPMPDLLHGLPAATQRQTTDDLLHYLSSLGEPINQRASGATSLQIDEGRLLFHRVGCVACHEPFDPPPAPPESGLPPEELEDEDAAPIDPASLRPSVPLGPLQKKTTVDALAKFLLDPLHVRPSGRMPNLNLEPRQARAIAAYLLRDQIRADQPGWATGLDVDVYHGSFNKTADIDEQKPAWSGESERIDLKQVDAAQEKKLKGNFAVRFHGAIEIAQPGVYRFWTKSDDGSVLRIAGQVVVDNDGIHPPAEKDGQIELTAGRHAFELAFTQGGGGYELAVHWQPPQAKKRSEIPADVFWRSSAAAMIPDGLIELTVDPAKAGRGRAAFAKLGCAACHQFQPTPVADTDIGGRGPALAELKLDASGGCLSDDPAAGRPRYNLSAAQRDALRTALGELVNPAPPLSAEAQIARSMTTLGCVACHSRDGQGGPDPRRAQYFTTTTEVDLGEEGRLPPALNEIGAKFTPEGMLGVLLKGWRMRPHMATRMPNFGKAAIDTLPELFAEVDKTKVPDWTPEFSSKMVDDGRMLVGKGALGCVNCHAWNEQKIQGADGLDLVEMTQRISPAWFHALLTDPQQLKPRTRMPTAWPNGKSFFPKIQGGDADRQIDAIWAYLAMGAKGGTPAGLGKADGLLLIPQDEPIVFRTFVDGIGAHAIAVGFRQRAHLAFDALGLRTAKVWAGDFISAGPAWEGRAGQYAVTPGSGVLLPAAPGFAVLESPAASWPVFDSKSKEPPAGYSFGGYRYDARRVPTFLYKFGAVAIEETPSTDYQQAGSMITRTFKLSAPQEVPQLWFRAAADPSIEEQPGGTFRVGENSQFKIRVRPDTKPVVRKVGDSSELLIPIELAKQNGQYEATLEVEIVW